MVLPLNHIKLGEQANILLVSNTSDMAQRMEDLGFVADEAVTCVLKGRRGGMQGYLVRNTVIGLRNANAQEILVETSKEAGVNPILI